MIDPEVLHLARTRRGPYLAALSAPPDRQAGMLAVVAMDGELARIPHLVSEPMLGRIRMQWWLDLLPSLAAGTVDAAAAAHPLVQALQPLALSTDALGALVEAHIQALDVAPVSVDEHRAQADAMGGALGDLLVQVLGVIDGEAAAAVKDVVCAWCLCETAVLGKRLSAPEDADVLKTQALALLAQARARVIADKAQRKAALPALLLARLVARNLSSRASLGAGAVLSVWWGSLSGRF